MPLVNVIHHVMTAHTSYRHTAGVGHYNVLVRTCDFTRFKSTCCHFKSRLICLSVLSFIKLYLSIVMPIFTLSAKNYLLNSKYVDVLFTG